MDSVAITEGIGLAASAVVFLVGLGMTWQKSKMRSDESRRLIEVEQTARKEAILAEAKERERETARIERLVEVNNVAAKKAVAEAEARGLMQFNNWSASRKTVDDAQAASSIAQSALLQALGAQLGKLEGMMIMMMQHKPETTQS